MKCARQDCGHERWAHVYGDDVCTTRSCECGRFLESRETVVASSKPAIKSIYVIGSMRNPRIPEVANALRTVGIDAYDDWHSSGPESDDYWMQYEKARGRTYKEALSGYHAQNVFELDKRHLDRCEACVLVAPAGKSGHLELGYMIGRGKPGYILLDGNQPERFDIMSLFATKIFDTLAELIGELT